MKNILKLTVAPLVSLFIFMLGSGLFTTLLALRLHHEGTSALLIGAMTGVYYAGLAIGSFKIESYIIRVGHIRSFAVFASILAVISFAQGIYTNYLAWVILRFCAGFATAGIFIVIESWLLSVGTIKIRGQIVALYMISLYGAQAMGQLLINVKSPDDLMLFALTAMLCSLSVIPICLTKISAPEISEPSAINLAKLFKLSGSGVIASLCSGLILGVLYGLLPLTIIQKTGSTAQVGLMMALLVFGGMFLQYPVGRLSDFIERRLMLLLLSLFTIGLAFLVVLFFHRPLIAYVAIFVFGGMVFTIYPVSISHACDALEQKDIVSGTQGVLLFYSFGATLGPFIAPLFIHFLGSNGIFIYVMVVCALLTCFLSYRKSVVAPVDQEEDFIPMPQTSPITAELDPRAD
jgi:MFS family permease